MSKLPPLPLARRAFLESGALGVAALAAAGCGKTRFFCTDESGLTDAQKKARKAVVYVDTASDAKKLCRDCVQWVPPAGGASCGACKVLSGPIHPDGTCGLFVARV